MPGPLTRVAARDAALAAVALGALTLPDPARLSPRQRHLLRLGSAGMSGWAGWRAAQDGNGAFVPSTAFGAAAGTAVALALAPAEDATDRWLADGLRRAGVGRPRVVMALAAAGLGALVWAMDARRGAEADGTTDRDIDQEHELDPALRELVQAMLESGDPQIAPVALAQLDSARTWTSGAPVDSTVSFLVDPDLPRLVPHTQVWPVSARWHMGEHPVTLFLQVYQGRLDCAVLTLDEAEYPGHVDPVEVAHLDGSNIVWPGLHAVTLVHETPLGTRSA